MRLRLPVDGRRRWLDTGDGLRGPHRTVARLRLPVDGRRRWLDTGDGLRGPHRTVARLQLPVEGRGTILDSDVTRGKYHVIDNMGCRYKRQVLRSLCLGDRQSRMSATIPVFTILQLYIYCNGILHL